MVTRQIGKYERLARERHEKDLALAALPGGHPRGLWFDQAAADRVISFVEKYCKHYEGEWAGKPISLEVFQKLDLIAPIFGWKRSDGTRRFRTAYVEIARKNGKSFLCSALSLYLLVADGEPGAQIYSSATKEDQAKIVWRGGAAMVKASPDLKRFVKEHRSRGGTLFCDRLGSFFKPLGSDSDTLDGLNPHGNVVDELHAHKDRSLWDVLDTAMGARRQPLTLAITTAGTYDPESIGWQQHDYATKVLEGTFEDDAFFAFIAALDEGDDPFSPATQAKANPNYGISIKPDYLAAQAEKAQRQPSFLNEYIRLHLNGWTQVATRWLSTERWNEADLVPIENALEQSKAREAALERRACWAGLDLSSKIDLAALVLAFPLDNDVIEFLCRFWLPENMVALQTKKGRKHYETWAREGWLRTTPGDIVDYDFIRAEINELSRRFSIQEVAFDPHNATQISTQLDGDGFTMVEFRQGFLSMSEPSKSFEAKIVARQVRHGGNPILRWMVGNAVVKRDSAGNIKPDKEKAIDKIDGVVASIMALGRSNLSPGTSSYLETQGALVL